MNNVIQFPVNRLPDEELAIRLWELVMAGKHDSDEFRHIDAEVYRRTAHLTVARAAHAS